MSAKIKPIEKPYLRQGTTLGEDRYRVDAFLEDNDLVVSYLGYDIFREKKVVIRELFPKAITARAPGEDQDVSCKLMSSETVFDSMKRHMIARAKKLISLYPVEGIANILTYFEQNGTVYAIEEYTEDTTSLETLLRKRHSVKFRVEDLLRDLKPVFEIVDRLHEKGIWHGSIKPDTILYTADQKPMLVHMTDPMEDVSAEVLGSPAVRDDGFSAVELYVPTAEPGPGTDIFSMGAILYRYTTGDVVLPYYQRINEKIEPTEPKDAKTQIMDFQSDAIMKAVALYDFDRFRSLDELFHELAPDDMDLESLHSLQEEPVTVKKLPFFYKRAEQEKRWYVIIVAVLVIFFAIFLIPRIGEISSTVRINHFYKQFNQADDYGKCVMLSHLLESQRKAYTNDYADLPEELSEEEQAQQITIKYYDFLLNHYVTVDKVNTNQKNYEYMKIDMRITKALVTYITKDAVTVKELALRPAIDGSYLVVTTTTDADGNKKTTSEQVKLSDGK